MDVLCQRFCLLSSLIMLTRVIGADILKPDESTTEEVEIDKHYQSPQIDSLGVYLAEHFDDVKAFKERWVQSQAHMQNIDKNNYDGKWEIQTPVRKTLKNDLGLVLVSEGKHAAISTLLNKPFYFKDKPLIVQYEVTIQEGQKCGGAYIKILSHGYETRAGLLEFYDQSPYTIMFGPDKCGNSSDLHFIYRYQVTQENKTVDKKYTKKLSQGLDFIDDKEPHMYTLTIQPNNTYTISIDNNLIIHESTFLEDFAPNGDRRFQMAPLYAVGFGVWSLTPMMLFDNVLVTDELTVAQLWAEQTFHLKRTKISKESGLDEEIKQYPQRSQMEAETDEGAKSEMQNKIQNKSSKADLKRVMFELFSTDKGSLELLNYGLQHPYGDSWTYISIILAPFTFIWILIVYLYRRYEPIQDSDARIRKTREEEAEDYLLNTEVEAIIEVETKRSTDEKQIVTDNIKLENPEPETIPNSDNVPPEERGQERSGANPWLYAGVIIGSCISVGVVTYMWFGLKSGSDAKKKKADADVEDDTSQSKVEVKDNDKKKSKQSNLDKSNSEKPYPELDLDEELKETDILMEYDFEGSKKIEDEKQLREDGIRIVNRSGEC